MSLRAALTLDRVLSRLGIASRTEGRKAILRGRLKVNGQVVRDPDRWVRLEKDAVHFDGQRVKPSRKVYLAFYKPKGVLTTHGDPTGRKTIYECLDGKPAALRLTGQGGERSRTAKGKLPWLVPVGRLDRDTSGLLLLTNDTPFADFVTAPQSQIPKTYLAKASALLGEEVIAKLNSGVEMRRGDWAHPLQVRRLEDRGKHTWLEIELTEGKNREVRRMIEAVGYKVLKLVRTRIGPITLEGLQVGGWRKLSPAEVAAVRQWKARG